MLNWDRKACASLWYLVTISPALKSLVRVIFFLIYPSIGRLVTTPPLGKVPVRFLWSSSLWRTHRPLSARCYLYHQYFFHTCFCFPLHLFDIPAPRVGSPWCRMTFPWWSPYWRCWISQIIYCIHLLYFKPLLIELVYDHYWDTWWTTSTRWEGCYTSSGPWPSHALLWNTCPPTTQSYWYPRNPWRVGMKIWIRGWIFSSQFLNRFPQRWRSNSSIPKSTGWHWGCHVWNGTSSCLTALRIFSYTTLFRSL